MKKTPVIIHVEGGIVDHVDSPEPLDILVMDYDKHAEKELSCSTRADNPGYWEKAIKKAKEEMILHDVDPAEFSDVLTDYPRPTIEKIVFKAYYDDHPHAEDLGEFKNDIDPDDLKRGSAFRWKPGDNHTFDYFVPAISVQEHRDGLRRIGYPRQVAETLARQYCRQTFQRMQGLDRGDWHYIGIMAKATVKTYQGNGIYRLENFTSGGLWGIETDAGKEYLAEIQAEELDDLKSHLIDYGVNMSTWSDVAPDPNGEIEDIDYL